MSIKGIFTIDNWDFKSESILNDLPQGDLELLLSNKTEHFYKKGEIIFREGGYPTGIFYLTEGKVKKYKLDKNGKEQIIYVANTGELLGYHAILSEDRYPDSAATLEECKIAFIPKEDFLETLHMSKVLSKRLLKTLSHEFAVLADSLSHVRPKVSKGKTCTTIDCYQGEIQNRCPARYAGGNQYEP